jgi:Protoglobin
VSHQTNPAPAADLPRAIREFAAFVEFGDRDVDTIRRTATLILAHERELTAAVYNHFLAHPQSARFFLDEAGAPDVERVERRRHSLGHWLRRSAEAGLDPETAYYLLGIGLSHSHRSWGQGGAVPLDLMAGAVSLIQTALGRLFSSEMPAEKAMAASAAWNKLLFVHLSVFLVGYGLPRAGSAH